jgi:hypothetical protein
MDGRTSIHTKRSVNYENACVASSCKIKRISDLRNGLQSYGEENFDGNKIELFLIS